MSPVLNTWNQELSQPLVKNSMCVLVYAGALAFFPGCAEPQGNPNIMSQGLFRFSQCGCSALSCTWPSRFTGICKLFEVP